MAIRINEKPASVSAVETANWVSPTLYLPLHIFNTPISQSFKLPHSPVSFQTVPPLIQEWFSEIIHNVALSPRFSAIV